MDYLGSLSVVDAQQTKTSKQQKEEIKIVQLSLCTVIVLELATRRHGNWQYDVYKKI